MGIVSQQSGCRIVWNSSFEGLAFQMRNFCTAAKKLDLQTMKTILFLRSGSENFMKDINQKKTLTDYSKLTFFSRYFVSQKGIAVSRKYVFRFLKEWFRYEEKNIAC